MFGIRNVKQSLAKTPCLCATIFRNTRGRRSGSGRLPELRRFWICCEARGLEREVRGCRVYPDKMPRMWGQRPEAPDLTYDRRLTARPAVLAKRTEPDRHTSRPTVDGPARTYPSQLFGSFLGDPGCPGTHAPLRRCRRLDPVSSVCLRSVERLIGGFQYRFRTGSFCRGGGYTDAYSH